MTIASRASLILLPFLLLIVAIASQPRRYTLTLDAVIAHGLVWTTTWPFDEITSITGEPAFKDRSFPLLSMAGLCSYTGWRWHRDFKLCRMHATDWTRAVLIRRARGNIVITPHDPQHFIARGRKLQKVGAEWR